MSRSRHRWSEASPRHQRSLVAALAGKAMRTSAPCYHTSPTVGRGVGPAHTLVNFLDNRMSLASAPLEGLFGCCLPGSSPARQHNPTPGHQNPTLEIAAWTRQLSQGLKSSKLSSHSPYIPFPGKISCHATTLQFANFNPCDLLAPHGHPRVPVGKYIC